MKGLSMPEDIGMTLILLVVVMVMIVLGVFIYLRFTLGVGEQIQYSIDFVSIQNKPFMVTEVLSHVQFGDRQLLEQAIETSAVSSVQKANTVGLPGDLNSFMKSYDLTQYYISVKRDTNEVMSMDSSESKCGENNEGWCVWPLVYGESCDVGRIEIDDKGLCNPLQLCCKHDLTAYVQLPDHSNIVPCGSGGVCSWGQRYVTWWNPLSLFNKRYCRQGQIYLGQPPECDGANGGATEVCCAPQTEETLLSACMAMKAVVPLLYKDRYGTMEVTVK